MGLTLSTVSLSIPQHVALATVPRQGRCWLPEVLGSDEPLLHGHGEDGRGGTIADGPSCRTHRRDLRNYEA